MYQKLSFMVVSLLALSSFVSQQTSGQITFIDPLQPTPAQLADPLTIGPGELVAVDPSGAPFGILMAEGNSVVNLTGGSLGSQDTLLITEFSGDSSFNANSGSSFASFVFMDNSFANISGGTFLEQTFGIELTDNATITFSGGVFNSTDLFGSDEFGITLGPDTSLEILGSDFGFTPLSGSGSVSLLGIGNTPISAGLLTGTFLDGNDFSFRLNGTAFDAGGFGGLSLSDPSASVPEPGSAVLIVAGAVGFVLRRRRA